MSRSRSLRTVAKGGAVFSLGSLAGTFLTFVSAILVIRMIDRSDYGLISLGMTFITILSVLSMLGFRSAVPRFLAKYRAQGESRLMGQVAGTAVTCAFGISLVFAILLHGEAALVARGFHKPQMAVVFEVLALMLPAMVLMETFTAIFQGMENARAKVIFQDLGANLLRLLLLLPVALAGLGLFEVLWVYVVSIWMALVIYLIYTIRAVSGVLRPQWNWMVAKDLLWFSFPLLGIAIMTNLIGWAGTLTLGYLGTAADVGLFNAPLRLANIIALPLNGMTFLYLPVLAKLAECGATQEVQELYQSTTKWAFIMTLPFLLYFLIDADFVVTALFGVAYHDAANVLRVMVVGVAVHTFVGPNGLTLIAFGITRIQFVATILAAVSAVVLCLLLVPHYGALGAAAGTATARIVSNIYISVALFNKFRLHPMTSSYLKPVLLAALGAAAAGAFLHGAHIEHPVAHVLVFFGVAALTFAAPLLTHTLSHADLDLIGAVERRISRSSRFTARARQWVGLPERPPGNDE